MTEAIQSWFKGHPVRVEKTREIFKVQINLGSAVAVLAYNKDRDRGGEFFGEKAEKIIAHFGLTRFAKPKTYVFGRYRSETKTVELEGDGELSPMVHPDW